MIALIRFSDMFHVVILKHFSYSAYMPPPPPNITPPPQFISPPKTPYDFIQAQGFNLGFYVILGFHMT